MLRTYAVDSNGTVVTPKRSAYNVLKLDKRKQELFATTKLLVNALSLEGIKTDEMSFAALIQPTSASEKLLLFFKTPLPASSNVVKESFRAKEDIYFRYPSDTHKLIYNSVFFTEENNTTKWWLLKVMSFVFERNFYDGKTINIYCEGIQYYAQFAQEKDDFTNNLNVAKQERKYMAFVPTRTVDEVRDIFKPDSLIDDVCEISCEDTKLLAKFDSAAETIMNNTAIGNRCRDSNQASRCIWLIIDSPYNDRVYDIYTKIKQYLRKYVPNSFFYLYKDNIVYFNYKEKDSIICIYVCGSKDSPSFVINGHIYSNFKELKDSLTDQSALIKEPWFENILSAYLPQIKKE